MCEKCVNFLRTFGLPLCYLLAYAVGDTAKSLAQGEVLKAILSTYSRYPAQRAFVVHVAQPAPGDENVPLGRAEHLVSGRTTHFASWPELVVFIENVLVGVEGKPP